MRRTLDLLLVIGLLFVSAQLFVLPFAFFFSTWWGLAVLELAALGVASLLTYLLVKDSSDFINGYDDHEDI